MFQRWLRRKRPAPTRRVAPLAEWLEPRLLFSADLAAGWLSAPVAPQDQEVRTLSSQGEYARAAQPQSLAQAWVTTALNFEKNVGQARAGIDYIANGSGYTIALSDGDADILLAGAKASVHLELVGGRDDVKAKGEGLLDARSNYLLGNDKSKWLTDIANHRAVLYEDVYRGIDVRYYGTQRQLEYDFIVAAGADASQIRLRFDGAEARLDAKGNLLLRTPEGRDITFDAPVSYQQGPNGREAVASAYRLYADGSVSIRLGAYDKSRELVIDPVLSYASYFGENNTETGVDIAVDAAGKVYVTGTTNSTSGVLGTLLGGLFGTNTVDTYVAKFNADLSVLEWSARIGGNGEDTPTAIAVDAAGSAVVTGWTRSTDFATSGAADTTRGGTQDAFVYRLNAAGTDLVFATYFGDANNGESGNGIALDAAGNIYVGGTASGASGGGTDAFVARYGSTGALQLQFRYGGGNDDTGNDIAVDAAGHIYIVGNSKGGMPAMLGGHQTGRAGGNEGFLARFDANGTLVYGTFIGGDEDDTAVALAVGANGRAYVVGQTEKSDDSGFQLTAGAWNTSRLDPWTGYLRIYDTGRTGAASLLYSTLVGGTGPDSAPVGVGLRGDVVIVVTDKASPGMAVTTDALKATHSPGTAHIAAINPGGTGAGDLVWGSYYGNGLTAGGVAVGGLSIYVAGSTGANGLATPGAADTTRSGQDAIVGRLTLTNDPPVLSGFNAPSMLEDLPGNGFTVLSLITGKLADTNAGAVLGIAITGASSAGGSWHYSLDGGGDWIALGTPAPGAALLLAADSLTRLRFTPAPNYNGTGATLTFRGWDRTAGLEGSTADATTGGGNSAFSVAEVTAPLTVVAVNDEPQRTAGTVANLDVSEGAPATSLGLGGLAYDGGGGGTEGGQTLTFTVTGVPGGSFGRIVLADGTTTVAAGSSYTLLQLQGMQFVGGTATGGSRAFSFSVVDNGGTSNGGDNTLVETLTITITNQAPVLAGSNPLPAIAEDVPSAGNNGMRVADLVAGRITDPLGVHGIAVVGAGSANGTWQYRRSDGAAWTSFGSVGAGNAVLLLADADDRIRFLPNANWNGTDTGLVFRAWDGSGGTAGNLTGNASLTGGSSPYSAATATASVIVTPVNDAPVASPVVAGGVEDMGPVTLVLGGSDIDGNIASITLGALPVSQGKLYTDASLLVEATPGTYAGSALTLYFVPAADFNGNASFSYTVTDNEGLSDNTPATVTIAVAAVNDAPVANDVAASGAEDGGAIAIVLRGTDVDGTVTHATFTTLPSPAQGRLYIDAARTTLAVAGTSYGIGTSTVYFVPAADFNGTVQFNYTVRDNLGASDATPGTVTVTVTPVNDAPVASGATAAGDEDAASIPITLRGTDIDGTVQSVTLVALPSLAQGKLYVDAALTVEATLATYTGGSLTLYFVPARDFNGSATFRYTVTDDGGATDASPATATITVAPVNDAPVARPAAATGDEDATSIAIRLDADDVDSTIRGYVLASLPANGLLYTDAALTTLASGNTLYLGTSFKFYFVPAPDFNGASSFAFTAVDASGLASDPQTATITVAAVNDAPVANGATASGTEDGAPVAIILDGRDIDGSVTGVTLQALPTAGQGRLYLDAAGTIAAALGTTYAGSALTLYFVPAHDFNGDATFAYSVTDDLGLAGAPATATVTIAAVNDAPVARPAAASGFEDAASIAIKLEADDVDNTIRGYVLGALPANGLLYTDVALTTLATGNTLYAGTSVTLYFVPAAEFSGTPGFTFTAIDASGLASDPQTATITVAAVNDAPVANGAAASGMEDGGAIAIDLSGSDIDGSVASFTLATLPPALQGKLYLDATLLVEAALDTAYAGSTRTLYFVPAANFAGNATFTYTVTDDLGLADATPATATIAVAPINDAPVLVSGTTGNLAVPDGTTPASLGLEHVVYSVGGGADEQATQHLTITITALPSSLGDVLLADGTTLVVSGGTYTLGELQGMKFRAAAGVGSGPATFGFTVGDDGGTANGGTNSLAQSLQVTVVNRAPVLTGANPLPAIAEDAAPGNGMLVSDLVDGRISDPQNTFGIAVVAASHPAGTWEYSRDGGASWQAFTGVADDDAVLLEANGQNRIRFVAVADWNGTAGGLVFRGWDQTGGTAGSPRGDTTHSGNATPYSDATAEATVVVTPVNDAPVAHAAGAAGNEDAASIAITLSASDIDNGIRGYELASLPTGGFLYTDATLTTLATANTLYLGTTLTLYFVPAPEFSGAPTFTFTAVDADGLASASQAATITVTPVNDAPVATPAAATGNEDATSIAITLQGSDVDGAVQSVTLASLPPAAQGKLYTDATLLVEATVGSSYAGSSLTLYFVPARDFNGQASFTYVVTDDLGAVDASPATATIRVAAVNDVPVARPAAAAGNEDATSIAIRLEADDIDSAIQGYTLASLPANGLLYTDAALTTLARTGMLYAGTTLTLYFVPAANYNGATSFAFTATDVQGLASAQQTATLTVTPVNDAPSQTGGVVADVTVDEGGRASLGLENLLFDAGGGAWEAGQTLTYTVTAVPAAGLGTVLLGDGSAVVAGQSYTLAQLQGMRFAAAPGVTAGSGSFSFAVRDSGGTANGGADLLQRSLAVTVRNQAPVLTGANDLPAMLEDARTHAGMLVADLVAGRIADPSNVFGIAVVAASSSAGAWEYSVDGGTTWTSLAGSSESSARLLAADSLTRVRFVPAPDWNGTASGLSFRAWDRSDGQAAGDTVRAAAGGADTAFSATLATARVVVTPVNDAPITPAAPVVVGTGGQDRITLGLGSLPYSAGAPDDERAQSLGLVITALPPAGSGALYLANGTAVEAGKAYSLEEARGMQFVPAAGASGGEVRIAYLLQDDGGTEGGGVDRTPGVLQLRITPAAPAADTSLLPAPPAPGGNASTPAPAPAPGVAAPPAPAPAPGPATAGVRPAPQAATGDALVESPAASTLLPTASDMSFAVERRVLPLESVRPAIGIAERAALQFVGFAGTGADFQVMGFNDLGAGGTRLTLEQLQQTLRSEAFLEQMDKLRENLRQEFDLDKTVSISVAGVSLGLSVAYVLWLVRGGVLVGSYLSALPAWRLLDPLPVLARAGEEEEDEEDEPLDARASARPADPLRGFA